MSITKAEWVSTTIGGAIYLQPGTFMAKGPIYQMKGLTYHIFPEGQAQGFTLLP